MTELDENSIAPRVKTVGRGVASLPDLAIVYIGRCWGNEAESAMLVIVKSAYPFEIMYIRLFYMLCFGQTNRPTTFPILCHGDHEWMCLNCCSHFHNHCTNM